MTMDVVSQTLIEAAESDIVGLVSEVNVDPLVHRVLLRLTGIVEAQSDQIADLEHEIDMIKNAPHTPC